MTDKEEKKQEKAPEKPSSQELKDEELGKVSGGLGAPVCATCGNPLTACTCKDLS